MRSQLGKRVPSKKQSTIECGKYQLLGQKKAFHVYAPEKLRLEQTSQIDLKYLTNFSQSYFGYSH